MLSKGRDDESFRLFVVVTSEPLGRLAFLLCGDHHLADDLVQNCLIRLYRAWPRIDRPTGVDAYVRQVLLHCWFSELRRPWRRSESRGTPVPDRSDELSDAALGVGSVHDREVLAAALARIPPRQRATVVLRYWSQLSVAETAAALRCSVGTVKSQTARGLMALRETLARHGVDLDLADERSNL